MLKKLRFRLTMLCSLITGAILIAMAATALMISESQLAQANAATFESNISAILTKLQNDRTVSTSWLAQTEAENRLIIHIEDNRHPLAFSGAWSPPTGRSALIEQAQEAAAAQHGVDPDIPPISLLDTPQAVFDLRGEQGERYLAAVALVSSANGWQSLTLLRDVQEEDASLLRQRLLYFGAALFGIALLFGFSWWFSGKAIRPIEENMRRQTEFVAAASHELRSPLAVIRAGASAIGASPDRIPQFTASIEQECARMGRLIEDMLLLAGSDAKTWTIRPEPVEMDTLLIETMESFLPLAVERRQHLLLDLPDDALPLLRGDSQRLRQALSVLIDNALQYTPEGGHITIRAGAQRSALTIEVSDDGPGIPPEHAAHIFDRFYRADPSRGGKGHFGLGLSIAKELIALHGGKLYLKQAEAQGCTFVAELPVRQTS